MNSTESGARPASPLTPDEERELERRRQAREAEGRADTGPHIVAARQGGAEAADFRFREEDDMRAAFPGSFNGAPGGGEGGNHMPGGFGGDGYNHYGETYTEGSQGGGAEGPAYFGDHGSNPDGTPRHYGSEGEENFDRGIRVEDPALAGGGSARFSNETAGYARDGGAEPAGGGERKTDSSSE